MALFTQSEGKRALATSDGGLEVQGRNMSKAYHVVAPEMVMFPLAEAGWRVRKISNLMESNTGWAQALEIKGRQELAPGYKPVFRMLFDNSGRHALKIIPGALRLECTNAFRSRDFAWRCRHDNHDLVRKLVEDPVAIFANLAERAATPLRRLDSLHNAPVHPDWDLILGRAKPRLGKAVHAAWDTKYKGDHDMWGLVQAMTEVKRPGAQEMADICLGEGWGQARLGLVPDELMAELARADVKRVLN